MPETESQHDRRMVLDAEFKAETTQALKTIVETLKGPPNRYEDGMEHKVNLLWGEWAGRRAARAMINAILAAIGAFTATVTAMWLAFHDAIIAFFRGLK